MTIFWGLMIPFIGTTLGALCVLFIKNELKPVIQKSLLGFAAGVMVAASVWSLLIPAMDNWHFYRLLLAFLSALYFFLHWTASFHICILGVKNQKVLKLH